MHSSLLPSVHPLFHPSFVCHSCVGTIIFCAPLSLTKESYRRTQDEEGDKKVFPDHCLFPNAKSLSDSDAGCVCCVINDHNFFLIRWMNDWIQKFSLLKKREVQVCITSLLSTGKKKQEPQTDRQNERHESLTSTKREKWCAKNLSVRLTFE